MVLLKDFIGNTDILVTLLKEDREYFKQIDLWHLEENNIKKNDIYKQLNQVLVDLQKIPLLATFEGTIYQKLVLLTATMSLGNKREMEVMLEALQSSLQNYYQILGVNLQVIAKSSAFIKNLFMSVMANRNASDLGTVYTRMGTLENP